MEEKLKFFNSQIKQKEETIAFYKEINARQFIKTVWAIFEQQYEIEFKSLKMIAFQNTEFCKDIKY